MPHKDKRFNPQTADVARQKWGEFIRQRREELGLSQAELGDTMGLHRNRIQEMELGHTNYAINSFISALDCLRVFIQLETRDPDDDVPGLGPIALS